MVTIKYKAKDAVLTFPKQLISKEYVREFIDRLNIETILMKSKLEEGDVTDLSEKIKTDWWKNNKQRFIVKHKN